MGLSGRRVDLLDQYEKKLEDLEDNLRMEQSSLAGEVRAVSACMHKNINLRRLFHNGMNIV